MVNKICGGIVCSSFSVKELCHCSWELFSLYNDIKFWPFCTPTSLANLVVEEGSRHSHQILLQQCFRFCDRTTHCWFTFVNEFANWWKASYCGCSNDYSGSFAKVWHKVAKFASCCFLSKTDETCIWMIAMKHDKLFKNTETELLHSRSKCPFTCNNIDTLGEILFVFSFSYKPFKWMWEEKVHKLIDPTQIYLANQ